MHSLIDTHSHIFAKQFANDIDAVIERAREAGIANIIVPATEPSDFEAVLELAVQYPEVRAAIGIHPHSAADVTDNDLVAVERIATDGKAIAIGEMGLDYYYDFSPKEQQKAIFREQLQIAKRLGLPAVIHNRESDEDLLKIIEDEQDGTLQFQLHCFSSNQAILQRALALGGMVSFTGNVTFPKAQLDGVVRAVPDDRYMIETDAPYLTPVPHRGKRNEPSYVRLVAEKIAEIREQTLETIMDSTTRNAQRFFKLAIAVLALLGASITGLYAQTEKTVTPIDTTQRPELEKWFGFGGHFASSTFISGSVTEANAIAGYGIWLSSAPLHSIGVEWLEVDFLYTSVTTPRLFDSVYNDFHPGELAPPNKHNSANILLRFIPKPRAFVSLYGSIGITYFQNEFGIDDFLIREVNDTTLKGYTETAWGIGGGLGLALNIQTPYGLIVPTAEFHISGIIGDRDLPKRQGGFVVSQPRIGVLLYPAFSKLF